MKNKKLNNLLGYNMRDMRKKQVCVKLKGYKSILMKLHESRDIEVASGGALLWANGKNHCWTLCFIHSRRY